MNLNIHTDQVGSLIRPAALLDARDDYKAGRIDRDRLRAVEDASILECLKMQKEAGVEIYGDGEFRRDSWNTPVSEAVDGFVADYPVTFVDLPDGRKERIVWHTKAVKAKLAQRRRIAKTDADFLREHAPGPFKITLPSPLTLRRCYEKGLTDAAYPDIHDLLKDGADIVRGEIVELAKEGVSYIQFDEGFIGYLRTDLNQAGRDNIGDREAELERDIALENSVYDAVRPLGIVTAMHMCRGSRVTHQKGGGSYDWLAERLFGAVHVDRFLLEYDDTERVGGYEPLRYLPKGKVAALGIVSSKDGAIETRDALLKEIERAAKFCPVEQLALTTQCGFQGASDRNGAHVSADVQKRKLARIAEVAHEVWG